MCAGRRSYREPVGRRHEQEYAQGLNRSRAREARHETRERRLSRIGSDVRNLTGEPLPGAAFHRELDPAEIVA